MWLEALMLAAVAGLVGLLVCRFSASIRAGQRDRDFARRELDAVAEAAQDIVFIAGIDGFLKKTNRYGIELFGYSEKEVLSRPFAEFVHPDDLARVREMVERISRGERVLDFVIRIRAADGSFRILEWRLTPLNEGLFSGVGRDITERTQAADSMRRLSDVLVQSPVSIMITDLTGRIEYVNPAFTKATGYASPEVVGLNPRILKSGECPRETYTQLWRTILAGNVWRGELHNRKKDGGLHWERATVAPLFATDGTIRKFIAFKEDMTRQKQLEVEYLQAQKMESIGRLAGGVAHDFNNLLTAINGYAHFVMEALPLDSPSREDVREIEAAGKRAAGLTQQLLAFSRKQKLSLEVLDLNDLVKEASRLLRRVLPENIELRCKTPDLPCFSKLDASQFSQVLMNLAVNARDAMPDGGTLTLLIERVSPGWLRLTVSDSGTGISEEARAHLFEPFFTTKPKGVGTGLGLSTVYGIVSQCGGQITVESAPGKGTTFHISFPETLLAAAASPPDSVRRGGAMQTVLIVDDEKGVRQLAHRALAAIGYDVSSVDCAAAALQALQEGKRFDLLITDVVMPGMSGPALAREFERQSPSTRILFMSGYIDDTVEIESLSASGSAFLRKPFTPPDLAQMVSKVLAVSPSQ